jgi:cyclic pyranopterin phosphate synthase
VIVMGTIADRLERPLRDLRISVTDRCNLRCGYCMPREVFGRDFAFLDRSELLSFEEMERIARLAAGEGVRKIRLTGGEPLLRRDLPRLVEMLARIEGVEDLALTTNGTALSAHAQALADAGLGRVTVSLDALEQQAFSSMSDTRVPVARVLAGIDAAHAAGLRPVKVNMVVRRGVNDHCVTAMAEHFRGREQVLRLIEYMDVGESNGWRLEQVVPASEMLAAIDARWPLRELPATRDGEVASRWAYRDGGGEIGVIHSVTEPFCSGCTRARLSADGQLYTCLFAKGGHDLRALLRGGASDAQLVERLREIWTARADRYSELRSAPGRPQEGTRVEMSYIGG